MVILLEGQGGAVEFQVGDGRWTDCWFVSGERVHLGSEDAIHLFKLLLGRFVKDEGPPAGELKGIPVKWVLSFNGTHSRFYAGDDGPKRVLFCVTLQGALLGEIRLEADEVERWRGVLEANLQKFRIERDET